MPDLREFVLIAPILLFSFVAHEYAHARTALWQGDDTAYLLGRVTLNPLPHIDPWMTILLPALLWVVSSAAGMPFTFGGAKPVPVVPRKYRKYVQGDLLVSSAGVITNFLLALLCAALFVGLAPLAGLAPGMAEGFALLQRMMMWGIWLNLVLCFFNLMPIPPLDGSHLLYHALPPAWGARYRALGQFGFLPLMAVLMFLRPLTNLFLAPAYWGFSRLYGLVAAYGIGDTWKPFGA
ncbi:MAG: site-2 protease family protein [Gemmatimonadetes bacterium]|nr:site-2 protease family protein [Gemmatimonadota bacterium]MBP6668462.1 site-2 protease family protein [Gemmatimonadales bacterium]MBK6778852.1 site-2 protease family protein [Gemmatimonadota bacterium]MBK7348837.1 site-2 protease family protein [Gemmatimonadota bacterium]MBK7714401.1 site-2 protease family protein [Gemmatimonadota bacterium]